MVENTWERFAMLLMANYGTNVDWDEGFFICPECGEPIYETDWDSLDLSDGLGNFICPVCESVLCEDD